MSQNNKLGKNLLLIGSIGYDIYLLNDNTMEVNPGGFSYYAASGIRINDGKALVISSISHSFNQDYLKKFLDTQVEIITVEGEKSSHNVYFFNLKTDEEEEYYFSESVLKIDLSFILNQHPLNNLHIHFGTSNPNTLISRLDDISLNTDKKCTFSTNLYYPYIKEYYSLYLKIINQCSIVFCNYAEFDFLRKKGAISQVAKDKILVVTCESNGAVVFVDGTFFCSFTPANVEVLNTIGAGDIFTGVFLDGLINHNKVFGSLIPACEIASLSVNQHGFEKVNTVYSRPKGQKPDEEITNNYSFLMPKKLQEFTPESFLKQNGNLIIATALYVVHKNTMLFVRKEKSKALEDDLLYVPGGKKETDESVSECAVRELREETNLEVKSMRLLDISHYQSKSGKFYIFYHYFIYPKSNNATANDDVKECVWVKTDEIDKKKLFSLTYTQIFLGKKFGIF
ncbi:MAG: PfkB family carbohydrate kinase [Bacteroidota bacterium]